MPGPRLDAGEWQNCLDALAAVAGGAAFVVTSGSLPAGVPDDFYARAARIVAGLGVRFILDSSGAPLADAARETDNLVKPYLGELSRLVGDALPDDAAFRAPPIMVKIVSAVRAGDSFLGAMVWSLARGDSLREAFKQ